MTMCPTEEPTVIEEQSFNEVRGVVQLGVGLCRDSFFPTRFAVSVIRRMRKRLFRLVKAGVTLGSMRLDIVCFLFSTYSQSLVLHALSFCDADSAQVTLLDRAQEDFARELLGAPTNMDGFLATAELGLSDYRTLCAQTKVLMFHRVYSNPEDDLSRRMFHWPRVADGSTTLDLTSALLVTLGIDMPAADYFATPYPQAKGIVKRHARSLQQETWRAKCEASPVNSNFTLHTKQKWGRDPEVIALPPKQAKMFLQARMGALCSPLNCRGRCKYCDGTPSPAHLIWLCPKTLGSRLGFFEETCARHPSIHRSILALDPHSALLFVLGQGVESARASDWSAFFRMAAAFVCEVRTLSVWPVHMSSPE